MQENPGSESGDLHGGSPEEVPPAPELLFEGLGAYDFPQGRAPDPRVSSLAGAANGARYKSMSPARLPITRSPCLTIPPGFSPSALLESPVLLTNIKAEPSPTTGTFSMASVLNNYVGSDRLSSPRDASKNSVRESGSSADFEFKPHTRQFSSSGLSSLGPLASVGLKQHEHEASAQIQSQTGIQALESSQMVKTETTNLSSHALSLSVTAPNPPLETSSFKASSPAEVAIIEPQPLKGSDNGLQSLQSDQNGSNSSAVGEKSSEDGYNWRKYGQKHVKGCAFPRSYYKCTHPNCQMKKQLERSHDGQVTEIVYKGRHDHPKPQPSRRLAIGAILSGQGEEKSDVLSSLISAADKSSSPCGHMSHHIDPNGTQDLSPVSASDDDAEVGGGHIGDDVADDDDPESKRRKKDTTTVDANPIGKANREPRVVVQTISEVDILDDGYRWRKYGQKVVKGNPNPRSYYKCTNAGCPVRKHVERASHDPKAVITTYEGKHNHDVPAARATGHETSASPITDGAGSLNGHMSLALAGMLRTCDTRPAANPFAQPAESDTISLDLGVGISANHGSTANEQQEAPRAEQVHSRPIQFSGSDYNEVVMQAIPVSTIYGGSSNGIFGSREDTGEGFSFKSQPMNRPPNLYYSNAGNMVMGP